MSVFQVSPIGAIRREGERIWVELERRYAPGLRGLELYSHVQVLWWCSRRDNPEDRARLEVVPRHGTAPYPMGVFSSRSPSRPNPIALSAAKITSLDVERGVLGLEWTDAEDGTPVLDIKPYSPGLDRVMEVREPAWHGPWPENYEAARIFKSPV